LRSRSTEDGLIEVHPRYGGDAVPEGHPGWQGGGIWCVRSARRAQGAGARSRRPGLPRPAGQGPRAWRRDDSLSIDRDRVTAQSRLFLRLPDIRYRPAPIWSIDALTWTLDADAPHTPAPSYARSSRPPTSRFIRSMDAEGRIVEWNGQAETDFGWRRDRGDRGATWPETWSGPEGRQAAPRGPLPSSLAIGRGKDARRRVEMQALHAMGHDSPSSTVSPDAEGRATVHTPSSCNDISWSGTEASARCARPKDAFRRAFRIHTLAIGMAICQPRGEWLQSNQGVGRPHGVTFQGGVHRGGRSTASCHPGTTFGDYWSKPWVPRQRRPSVVARALRPRAVASSDHR